jgi:hypothetical protein
MKAVGHIWHPDLLDFYPIQFLIHLRVRPSSSYEANCRAETVIPQPCLRYPRYVMIVYCSIGPRSAGVADAVVIELKVVATVAVAVLGRRTPSPSK